MKILLKRRETSLLFVYIRKAKISKINPTYSKDVIFSGIEAEFCRFRRGIFQLSNCVPPCKCVRNINSRIYHYFKRRYLGNDFVKKNILQFVIKRSPHRIGQEYAFRLNVRKMAFEKCCAISGNGLIICQRNDRSVLDETAPECHISVQVLMVRK
ncbi:hypothetical protein TNCT_21 [Trichonephila clavata]|uniref:Uncharacterized protein n=1 Tax=Trichonephila clavata TaxID=2740835 RepID=A0A8X6HAF3_TRICU|nr:hypothetical protein TNCT_196571 [Trichonephila clavata]GFR18320.1 hypothetical protein TNCT_21 [Trichonephila clavata]